MFSQRAIGQILNAFERAENQTISGWSHGEIETEPSFTDRMVGSLQSILEANGLSGTGYSLTVRTLRDRGPFAPERTFGADLVVVLDVNTVDFRWIKGFLAQAKMTPSAGIRFPKDRTADDTVTIRRMARDKDEPASLFSQCSRMLGFTAASYVLLYDTKGVYVLPASTVVAQKPAQRAAPAHVKRLRWFMGDFFSSFVGDYRLRAIDDATLTDLANFTGARAGLLFSITDF